MSGVFVLLSMTHPQFEPEVNQVPSMIGHGSHEGSSYDPLFNYVAKDFADVGLTLVQTSDGKVISWSFVFVLYENISKISNNELFGRVIHPKKLEAMMQLSKSKKSERKDYSLTLESQ